ncbi:NHS-like protein 3 isoform X2 [Scyliorhinus torazame]|uniref:NHS-like protein 3 isoform X2 n=1 Tax=Scyliorhinus torazame TaxID=75743 RepID=UPI003B5CF845
MGNTHHTKKVQGAKSRPLRHFAVKQPDKKKKASSKVDEESKYAVHYKPAQYEHQQENIFLPSTRPQHLEDLHKEAEIGLKSLQDQGNLDGYSQPHIRNGYGCEDGHSQHGEDDASLSESSKSCTPSDEVWATTRSLPPPTPGEVRKDLLPSRSGAIPTGTTFKPQPHQKVQSSFKGPKLKEKRIRRTTIMGIPQHVQQELGIGKKSHLSNTSQKVPDADSAGVVSASGDDENHRLHIVPHSRARGSLRSVNFTDSSQGGNESISTLDFNWELSDFPQRPKSLAIPKSSIPSELLQSPVMSMSPQATYLSKIIPNAILPAAVDVLTINTSQNGVRTLSRNSLICDPSPAYSLSTSLQNYDGRDYASSDAWSHSQSSETIVSNNSTISSQGNAQIKNPVEEDRERTRDQHNVTNSAPDPRANTSRWVNACSARNVAAATEDTAAHNTSNHEPNELKSNGCVDQSLSPAQSTSSIIDASDTQSVTSERSISRSLSVKKMKKPPAPPRRIHSLQQAEEQNSEFRHQSCASPGEDDVFAPSLGEIKNIQYESCGGSPVAAAKSSPNHIPVTAVGGGKSKGNILHSTNNSPPQNATSPNKSERTMSPSSGYSSQSGTPTLVRNLGSPSPPIGTSKPTASERSTSITSPVRLHSTSSASISSSVSGHVDLFSIPPPPSSPAPPPPTVKIAKLPPSLLYAWGPGAIPPPPAGPAPSPPRKKTSFLFGKSNRPPLVTAATPVTAAAVPPVSAATPVTVAATPPVTAAIKIAAAAVPPVTAASPVTVATTSPVTAATLVTVAAAPPVTVATPVIATAGPPVIVPLPVTMATPIAVVPPVTTAPAPPVTAAPALPVTVATLVTATAAPVIVPLPVTMPTPIAVAPPVTAATLVTVTAAPVIVPPPVTVPTPIAVAPQVTEGPAPLVTVTPAPAPPVTVTPATAPPVTVIPTTAPPVTVTPATAPPVTVAVSAPLPSVPVVSAASTTTVTTDETAQALLATGNVTVVDLPSASALVVPHILSTSVPTPVLLAPPEQEMIPLAGKSRTPPPSPPPAHHPPPPKKTTVTEKLPLPVSSNVSEASEQEQSGLDWPPPPPPLSPSVFTPSTEISSSSENISATHSGQQDAEFLFPPPPPPLLTGTAQENTSSAGDFQLVSPPAAPPAAPEMTLKDATPVQPVPAAFASPSLPPSQPTETKVAPMPKSSTLSAATAASNNLQQKPLVSGLQSATIAGSQLSKVMTQTPKVSHQDSEKELTVQPSPNQDGGGQDSKPIVTASLLQMVRLRSVQMTTYGPGVTESQQQVNKNHLDLKPITKSNVTAPSKPARKSLLRLSSSSDSESPVKPTNSLSVKKPTLATGVQGQTMLKPPDDGALHKSPASTASFIFSKNISPKKLVFETPHSPEAQAEVKKSLMAELNVVSGRIASKTESRRPTNPQSKTVSETPSAQKKPNRIPPPVAKKPLFLPNTHRLPSASTAVRELSQAQEKSDVLGAASDAKDEKGKLEKGNGQLALQKRVAEEIGHQSSGSC